MFEYIIAIPYFLLNVIIHFVIVYFLSKIVPFHENTVFAIAIIPFYTFVMILIRLFIRKFYDSHIINSYKHKAINENLIKENLTDSFIFFPLCVAVFSFIDFPFNYLFAIGTMFGDWLLFAHQTKTYAEKQIEIYNKTHHIKIH